MHNSNTTRNPKSCLIKRVDSAQIYKILYDVTLTGSWCHPQMHILHTRLTQPWKNHKYMRTMHALALKHSQAIAPGTHSHSNIHTSLPPGTHSHSNIHTPLAPVTHSQSNIHTPNETPFRSTSLPLAGLLTFRRFRRRIFSLTVGKLNDIMCFYSESFDLQIKYSCGNEKNKQANCTTFPQPLQRPSPWTITGAKKKIISAQNGNNKKTPEKWRERKIERHKCKGTCNGPFFSVQKVHL